MSRIYPENASLVSGIPTTAEVHSFSITQPGRHQRQAPPLGAPAGRSTMLGRTFYGRRDGQPSWRGQRPSRCPWQPTWQGAGEGPG